MSSWVLKTKLPNGATFNGEMVFNSTDLEIDNDLRLYFDSVRFRYSPQYIIKNTGFEKKKYKHSVSGELFFDIMLVGNLPKNWRELLEQLAIAINGSGMILQFVDNFVIDSTASPATYDCRWLNAGDFVDNNVLFAGGTIELATYTLPEDQGRWAYYGDPDSPPAGEWEKTIDAPGSGEEWTLQIEDEDADVFYVRVP